MGITSYIYIIYLEELILVTQFLVPTTEGPQSSNDVKNLEPTPLSTYGWMDGRTDGWINEIVEKHNVI